MPFVLLVDDSAVARRAIATRFAAEGFTVHEAGTGVEARKVDLATITCAVIDVELEDTDGPTLAAALLTERPALPVAFFTAGASNDLVKRSRSHGPVFTKPDLDPLLAWAKGTRP